MQRGPKPAPLELKLLSGKRSKLIPKQNKAAKADVMDPLTRPDWVTGPAAEEWDRVTAAFVPARVLVQSDMAMLAVYCRTWADYDAAERALQAHGSLLLERPSGVEVKHPLIDVKNEAARQLCRLGAELGITPSARGRVTNAPKHEDSSDLEVLIGRRKAG